MKRKMLFRVLAVLLAAGAAGVAAPEVRAQEASGKNAPESAAVRAAEGVQTGSVDRIVEGSVTWIYDPATGETVVTGAGTREIDSYNPSSPFPQDTKSIRFEDCTIGGNYSGLFKELRDLQTIDFAGLTAEHVTDMGYMFNGCKSLTSLDVSKFDTGNVTNMESMFNGCESLTSLDLSNFETGDVTSMAIMFQNCRSLASLNVSKFDTGNVTDMAGMFSNCSGLTSLDVSKFDTGNVTFMAGMFNGCRSMTSLDLSKFDTGNVTTMERMFLNCVGLASLDVSGFDTGNVMSMREMFHRCSSLQSLDLSCFNIESVQNVTGMLGDCNSLVNLNAPGQAGENEIAIFLPYVYKDSEGNETSVLDRSSIGKLLTKAGDTPTALYHIGGEIKYFGETTETLVELISIYGKVGHRYLGTTQTHYSFLYVPAGTYTLRVSKPNHVTREYSVTVTDADVTQDVELQLPGDINGDGTINARDKKMLFNHIEKISELTGYLFEVGDVNGDGTINARDKKMLYNHIEKIAPLW